MGGVVGGPGALDLPWTEHNFRSDPEAAHIVLASGAAIKVVPLDVTVQVRIRAEDTTRIRAAGTPFHRAVADQIDRYPGYRKRGWTYLHDPLAVATLIRPELVTWEPVAAAVETEGRYSAGKLLVARPSEDGMTSVALAVEAARAESFIVERLAS